MSLNNSFHLEGNVSHIGKEPNPDGGTKYAIRLSVRVNDADDPNFGGKDFVTVTAYGTGEYDPWADLERGVDCAIDGEVTWEGGKTEQEMIDGEWKAVGGGAPVILGITLRSINAPGSYFSWVGSVEGIEAEPAPDGRTEYLIRFAVDDPGSGGRKIMTATAFGSGDDDPWARLEPGVEGCIFGEGSIAKEFRPPRPLEEGDC